MTQHFARHAAVAAADDQNPPRRAMGEQRRVGEHLMIDVLIALRHLHNAVEGENPAEDRVLEDLEALMIGAAVVDHPRRTQPLAIVRVQRLVDPVVHSAASTIPSPRRSSFTRTSRALNARRRTPIAWRGSASPHMKTSNAP